MVKDSGNTDQPVDEDLVQKRKPPKYIFKILLTGDECVGKTCLRTRYASNEYYGVSYIPTIGVDFSIKVTQTEDGDDAKLQLWEAAGNRRFRTITQSYYRGVGGALIIFDVNNKNSFLELKDRIRELREYNSDNAIAVIVGNKADSDNTDRIVSTQEGKEFASEQGLAYFETSAKENINVDEAFAHLVNQMVVRYKETHANLKPGDNKKAEGKSQIVGLKETKQKSSTCVIL